MNDSTRYHVKGIPFLQLLVTLVLLSVRTTVAFTLNVIGPNGENVSGFRWLVQRDTTIEITPGVIDTNSLAMRFHTSYIPVVTNGVATGSTVDIALPDTERYFVSVLPNVDYSIGGASISREQTAATVTVNALPFPTAQISVFVFEDNANVNGAPDLPDEQGLAGFKVVLFEAGGRYGMSGGRVMTDLFGNMLGTVYDENGDILQVGSGVFYSDETGNVTMKNLAQGKYGVQVFPPAGEGWHQTATIEGSKTVDAWVKANEPQFFVEFGPPSWHTFFGFTKETNDVVALNGTGSISGQVVVRHSGRPPDFAIYAGAPFPGAWVSLHGASRTAIYTGPCDEDSRFSIPNVPPGTYQLTIWDENLDILIDLSSLTVADGENVDLGLVPVFAWFGRLENHIFHDINENGFRDPGEPPIPEQAVNLRFRDGTIYQSFPTDLEGFVPFDEVFPFFHWLVAEVDFTRFKATGVTIVTDEGGAVLADNGWDHPSRGILSPQPQFDPDGVTPSINPNTSNNLSRTETGPVLTEAFQVFAGQTTVMEWGKSTYDLVDADNEPLGNFPGPEDTDHNGNGEFDSDNGGISGVIFYSTTRAEDDPRFAAGEPWEPGIPRVQVNLYADFDGDREIDDLNGDLTVTLADVDNYPLGNFPGSEDIDRNSNTNFDYGDAMSVTTTDSWDDNQPEGAQGEAQPAPHGATPDAFDGLPNYNQTLPGLFDGGYAFNGYVDNGVEIPYLPTGTYIVEAVAPPGYEHVKEENKNVDFGDEYDPAPFLLPPMLWAKIILSRRN